MSVEDLIRTGRLERVTPDRSQAMRFLDQAGRHLRSARGLLEEDPAGAFSLLYDGIRKSLTAHLAAHGLRVRSRPGAPSSMPVRS